ncbi:hypothetical protein Rhe02_36200 [Rhizocola hellebori]|uniref:DUF6234 domain-containing protein n=1 Tax=Rhizocola hellebori TaxID=1392758 RepID=A0A8J3Q7I7_9ACTN|nr:DUF6234 family protein [Rhizocola hellebori]GIH05553.1 hypothetical protein Rhe02_36200 [Rhizocola hellebori]
MPYKRGLFCLTIVAWIVALLALCWQFWGYMWEHWAASYDGGSLKEVERRGAQIWLNMAIALVVGPALIAVAAAFARLKRTAVTFAVVAALLLIPGAALARESYRDLHPAKPSDPPRYTGCVPISGGRQCPGG